MDTLKQRALTVAVALPLFLAGLFLLPSAWWSLVMAALLLVGGDEWARLARFSYALRIVFLVFLMAGCGLLAVLANHSAERWVYAASLLLWCTIIPACLRFKWSMGAAALMITGIVVLLPTWLALTRLQSEPRWLLMALAVIWIADSAAFFAGKRWGRHKLAAQISPGKTWEGVAGAVVAVMLYAWWAGAGMMPNHGAAIGMFLAMLVLSVIGDLFESWLKRTSGVKDSGNWLPGHGGLLDRIDGVTAALPFAALLHTGGT